MSKMQDLKDQEIYLISTFPPAIARLVDICFKSQLRQIAKSNIAFLSERRQRPIKCPAVLCNDQVVINKKQAKALGCDFSKTPNAACQLQQKDFDAKIVRCDSKPSKCVKKGDAVSCEKNCFWQTF